jgi:DNA-binding transcriptional ArsR family regulator
MALRMLFERQDLQRVRLAPAADPLWELLLSMQSLQERRVPAHHTAWRQAVRKYFAEGMPRWANVLGELIPARGDFPDFLTPAPFSPSIDSGCEALVCTSPTRLLRDLTAAFGTRRPSPWVQALAIGEPGPVRELGTAVRAGYGTLLAPHWPEVRTAVAADRSARIATLAGQGSGPLLAGLPGVVGWDGETLELAYPVDRTVRLGGRGLTLVPSYFCAATPVTLIDTDLPPVLVYPARHPAAPFRTECAQVPGSLGALLGPSRAKALWSLDQPLTTSRLAERLGASVASASRHAATLRDAGLITSTRTGAAVVHRITDVGAAVLAAGAGDGRSPRHAG